MKTKEEIPRVYVTSTEEDHYCHYCDYTGPFEKCNGSWPWCPYCGSV